jgi:hypothetical protein
VAGEKLQLDAAGSPEQENVVGRLKLLTGVITKEKVAGCPALTVAVIEEGAIKKSGGGGLTVSVVVAELGARAASPS